MRFLAGAVIAALLAGAALGADALKIYISADVEGIGGVNAWDLQAEAKGREYEKFGRLMTLEVNAAVEGAFDAGATEVIVSDSMWTRRRLMQTVCGRSPGLRHQPGEPVPRRVSDCMRPRGSAG